MRFNVFGGVSCTADTLRYIVKKSLTKETYKKLREIYVYFYKLIYFS